MTYLDWASQGMPPAPTADSVAPARLDSTSRWPGCPGWARWRRSSWQAVGAPEEARVLADRLA